MPRTIRFWEARRAKAEKALLKASAQLVLVKPSRAPSRRDAATLPRWRGLYVDWQQRAARRSKLLRTIDQLRARIAYHDERLQALKSKNAWHAVARGLF